MSDSEVNDQPAAMPVEPDAGMKKVSPGARLAAYREERGWTVEQVASQLNLAPRQVVAIEQDDYPALPGMPIVRGFVRAYAKLLKVDAAPLLADLGGETVLVHDSLAPRKTLSTPFSEARLPSMNERPGLSSRWVVGALLVILLGVGIWAARHGSVSTPDTPATAPMDKTGASSAPGAAGDQVQPAPGKDESHAEPAAAAANPAPAATAPAGAQDAVPAVPASEAKPAPAAAPESLSAVGKDALQIKAREDSWVEVRRAGNGGVIVSRVVKAGETENVEVTEPVSVVIGNAAGVDATLRGTPLELKSGSRSNVARLNLK
ncbi:MAG TPA: RodZ domain-containing protein [Noviherbaspirillum sp.]|uniref:helix-turn-helix domain-containing protein n=1 Tax=Noviherbaspirillum sp. TaxID=1926288 RepID=UPI002D3EA783|nr:RodZ domain-containing protein [Noviherbaspirillum sp.]HYD96903.1 RodZ domain-containing protein [Noviherbaspirillum sp.]